MMVKQNKSAGAEVNKKINIEDSCQLTKIFRKKNNL